MIARHCVRTEKLGSSPGQLSQGINFSGWHCLDMSVTVTKRRENQKQTKLVTCVYVHALIKHTSCWILTYTLAWMRCFYTCYPYINWTENENIKKVIFLYFPVLPGWPKIHMQVWHQDGFGRNELYGYGHCHIPTSPGMHKIDCATWRPSGTLREQIMQTFVGGSPQLKTPDLIYRWNEYFGVLWS